MSSATYASRLRYLDADDVDDGVVEFDRLDVIGSDGHKIGAVDGFIVDPDARRVNYIVVDAGGWFSSKRLLLPIGHASLDPDRKSLRCDVSKEALRRLPEFEEDRFREFSDEELRAFERNTVLACCPDEPLEQVSNTGWSYDSRRHYAQPDWWRSNYAPERLHPIAGLSSGRIDPTAPAPPAQPAPPVRDAYNPDLVTARERRPGDESPHHDGRAQPGDVLGIETGGERTGIGDTEEDEDRTRRP